MIALSGSFFSDQEEDFFLVGLISLCKFGWWWSFLQWDGRARVSCPFVASCFAPPARGALFVAAEGRALTRWRR